MAAHGSGLGRLILALAPAAAPHPMRGAGPADAFADFGPLSWLAIALDVINTLIVIYYVWRIWVRREPSAPPRARPA